MSRYIDADELREEWLWRRNVDDYCPNDVLSSIDETPTADVAPTVHGQWLTKGIATECSVCGKNLVVEQGDADLNYCPNCGAKMDGDSNV